jgi:hypothetical protein
LAFSSGSCVYRPTSKRRDQKKDAIYFSHEARDLGFALVVKLVALDVQSLAQ